MQEQQGKEQLREQLSNLQDEYEDLSKQLRMKEAEIEDKIMQINTLSLNWMKPAIASSDSRRSILT